MRERNLSQILWYKYSVYFVLAFNFDVFLKFLGGSRCLSTCRLPRTGLRILLENMVVAQLVKKFFVFCRIWRFVTLFTRAHHRSQSSPSWIQATPSYLFNIHFNIILSIYILVSEVTSSVQYFRPELGTHFHVPYSWWWWWWWWWW
jgi:hypothetical protein